MSTESQSESQNQNNKCNNHENSISEVVKSDQIEAANKNDKNFINNEESKTVHEIQAEFKKHSSINNCNKNEEEINLNDKNDMVNNRSIDSNEKESQLQEPYEQDTATMLNNSSHARLTNFHQLPIHFYVPANPNDLENTNMSYAQWAPQPSATAAATMTAPPNTSIYINQYAIPTPYLYNINNGTYFQTQSVNNSQIYNIMPTNEYHQAINSYPTQTVTSDNQTRYKNYFNHHHHHQHDYSYNIKYSNRNNIHNANDNYPHNKSYFNRNNSGKKFNAKESSSSSPSNSSFSSSGNNNVNNINAGKALEDNYNENNADSKSNSSKSWSDIVSGKSRKLQNEYNENNEIRNDHLKNDSNNIDKIDNVTFSEDAVDENFNHNETLYNYTYFYNDYNNLYPYEYNRYDYYNSLPTSYYHQNYSYNAFNPSFKINGKKNYAKSSYLLKPRNNLTNNDYSGVYSLSNEFNPDNFVFNGEHDTSEMKRSRFYVIKSYSSEDVVHSIKYGIWCSTEQGNKKLDEAFNDVKKSNRSIYLFFSVNGSGQFCGMAEMLSNVDYSSSSKLWTQDKWKGQFEVKWIFVKNVPNTYLKHIILPNNENKPVTNSRDTQEILYDQALTMIDIFRQFDLKTSILEESEQFNEIYGGYGNETMSNRYYYDAKPTKYYHQQQLIVNGNNRKNKFYKNSSNKSSSSSMSSGTRANNSKINNHKINGAAQQVNDEQ